MKNQIQLLSNTHSKSGKFAASRQILVVTHGTLLDEGVANLLTHQQGLEVWGIGKDDTETIVCATSQIRPAVLLLFHTHPDEQKELLQQLDACPNSKRLTIIILHLNSNSLYVHREKDWSIVDGDAFFPLIHGHHRKLTEVNSSKKSLDKSNNEKKPAIHSHDLPGLRRLLPTWGLLPSGRMLGISTRQI